MELKNLALELAIKASPSDAATDDVIKKAQAFEAYLGGKAAAAPAAGDGKTAEAPKSRSGARKPADDKKADDKKGAENKDGPTKEKVRDALKDLAGKKDQKAAVTLLRKYAKTLDELDPKDFQKVIDAAEKAAGGEEAEEEASGDDAF